MKFLSPFALKKYPFFSQFNFIPFSNVTRGKSSRTVKMSRGHKDTIHTCTKLSRHETSRHLRKMAQLPLNKKGQLIEERENMKI